MSDEPISEERKSPEIIAIASGRGGTGKTLLTACLGHALSRAGHRVLLVDTDTSTDGLSLYLLGAEGRQLVASFSSENTVRGYLDHFRAHGEAPFEIRRLERSGEGDHGVDYHILISGKALYGELDTEVHASTVTELGRESFREAIQHLFDELHELPYHYVLVDTRGGFGFETTDVCALADGFVLVTDPDPSCLFQDRNFMHRVSAARVALAQRGELRGIIVNHASDGDEAQFRRELALEFGVPFDRTHAVPLDLEAMKAHRAQQIPYAVPAAAAFSHATLTAFSNLLSPGTALWSAERASSWAALLSDAALALQALQRARQEEEEAARSQEAASLRLTLENESLRAQLSSYAEDPTSRRSVLWSVLLGVTLGFAVLVLWMRWDTSRRAARLATSAVVSSTNAVSPASARQSGAVLAEAAAAPAPASNPTPGNNGPGAAPAAEIASSAPASTGAPAAAPAGGAPTGTPAVAPAGGSATSSTNPSGPKAPQPGAVAASTAAKPSASAASAAPASPPRPAASAPPVAPRSARPATVRPRAVERPARIPVPPLPQTDPPDFGGRE